MTKQGSSGRLKSLFIFLVLALVVTNLFGVLVIIPIPISGIFLLKV